MGLEPISRFASVFSPPARVSESVRILVSLSPDAAEFLLVHARQQPFALHLPDAVSVDVLPPLLVLVIADLEWRAPRCHDLSLAPRVFDEIPRWLLRVLHRPCPHQNFSLCCLLSHPHSVVLEALVAPERYLRNGSASVSNNDKERIYEQEEYTPSDAGTYSGMPSSISSINWRFRCSLRALNRLAISSARVRSRRFIFSEAPRLSGERVRWRLKRG